jgi:hypothetical protein
VQPGAAAGSVERKPGALAGRHDLPAGSALAGGRGREGSRHPDREQQTEGTDRHQHLAHLDHSGLDLDEDPDVKTISADRARFQLAGGRLM